MKKFHFTVLLLMFLPTVAIGKEPTVGSGVQLVKDYVNDFCGNVVRQGFSFDRYLHPDYTAVGGDNFNAVIVERNLRISGAKIVTEKRNFNYPDREEAILEVTVLFHEVGYFKDFDHFVAEKKVFLFKYYPSKSTGKYLILDTDDNEIEISFYDAIVKDVEDNLGPSWQNPKAVLSQLRAARK